MDLNRENLISEMVYLFLFEFCLQKHHVFQRLSSHQDQLLTLAQRRAHKHNNTHPGLFPR